MSVSGLFKYEESFLISSLDTDIATAVTWAPDSQLFSCGDYKIIYKWTADGEQAGKMTNINAFITAISWSPVVGKQVILFVFFLIELTNSI